VKHYPQLAKALLRCGDSPNSVAEFLRYDYGLDPDQAKAALNLADALPDGSESHDGAGADRPMVL
jgi:hypothetical protein